MVLDLDDTLLASARARMRARRHLSRIGIDPRRFAAADQRMWRSFSAGEITIDGLRMGRMAAVGLTGEAAREADAAYREIAAEINLKRGAARLLTQLRAAGMATVILTNGTVDPQRRKVLAVGLDRLVDAVLVTEEIGHHKPDPRAFRAALAEVGGRAEEAAMVGDTDYADIEGALGAGFSKAIWVTRKGRVPHPDPRVATVSRLEDVPAGLGLD